VGGADYEPSYSIIRHSNSSVRFQIVHSNSSQEVGPRARRARRAALGPRGRRHPPPCQPGCLWGRRSHSKVPAPRSLRWWYMADGRKKSLPMGGPFAWRLCDRGGYDGRPMRQGEKRRIVILPALLVLALCLGAAICSAQTRPEAKDQSERALVVVPFPQSGPSFLSPDQLKPLELTDIFPPRDLSALPLDPNRLRVLLATGDVIPARHTDFVIRSRNDDFSYPFAATKDLLAAGDLTLVNLEAPLIKKCPQRGPRFQFCGRPGFAKALKDAGVDVVTLENNHISNYGRAGIGETIKYLEASGIAWADRQTAAILEVRGLKFGFLAFNGVGEAIKRAEMVDQIEELRPRVDILAVAFHWGAEYVQLPRAAPGIAPDNPIEIAHLAADAGADLTLGNHPHQVQAVEIYKGKFIAYAHGNFIFDQMWSHGTRVGVLGRYVFYDAILVKVEYLPVRIDNYAQPVPLQGEEAEAVLDQMREASEALARQLGSRYNSEAGSSSHPRAGP